jgi:DNA-binding ferritin-like protein
LFQKLYEAVLPEIDGVAERAVGTGGIELVDPIVQAGQTHQFVQSFAGNDIGPYVSVRRRGSPLAYVQSSLQAELALLGALEAVLSSRRVSQGTQNLLQGIADTHEGHVYLLQQRAARQ